LTVLPVSSLVEITPLKGGMRGRGVFLLASCLRRWDMRPSPRKDSRYESDVYELSWKSSMQYL
jgi:hypothetical protein